MAAGVVRLDDWFSKMDEVENRPRKYKLGSQYFEYHCRQFILTIKPEKDSKGEAYHLLTVWFENPFDLRPISEITELLKITGTNSLSIGWVNMTSQDQCCSGEKYGGVETRQIDGGFTPEQMKELILKMIRVSAKMREDFEKLTKNLRETIRDELEVPGIEDFMTEYFFLEALDHQRSLNFD